MKKYLLLVILFASVLELNAQIVTIGSGTNVNGTTTSSPVNIWYRRAEVQMVYTAAELNAAGINSASDINRLGFFVTQAPAYELPNYQIKIKHTNQTNANNNFGLGGWTISKSAFNYMPTAGDWDLIDLDIPFAWNGTDNIVVQICNSQVQPNYNASGQCRNFASTNGYLIFGQMLLEILVEQHQQLT